MLCSQAQLLQARRSEVLRSPRCLLQARRPVLLQARCSEVLRSASDLLPEDHVLQHRLLLEEAFQPQWLVQAFQEEPLWLQQLLRPEADLLQARRSELLRSA